MTAYLSGEISPTQIGNIGDAYQGATELQDGFVSTSDGATMVPGYIYTNNTDNDVQVVNVPFVYSQTDAYNIEFGPLYIRFYRNKTLVLDGASAYEVVTTYTADELSDLDFYQVNDILYITHGSHQRAKLVRFDHGNWVLSDLEMTDGPFLLENSSTTTITADDVTGSVALIASVDTFESGNVSGLYRLRHDLAEQRVEDTISGTGASNSV